MNIVLGCVGYLSLLAALRNIWPDGILFYQGFALAVATALVQWIVVRLVDGDATPIKDAVITFLVAYAFMFTVPTTVDRAYSVRMLTQLEAHSQGMTRSELEKWFSDKFAAEGVGRRLQEQMVTGSIEERDGRYQLTDRGQHLVSAFVMVQNLFATQSTN